MSSFFMALLLISSYLVLLAPPRQAEAANTESVQIGMPFTGNWAYDIPTTANCGPGDTQTAHPSCHELHGSGYHWSVDVYQAAGTPVKLKPSNATGNLSYQLLDHGQLGSCGNGVVVRISVDNSIVGDLYVDHMDNVVSSSGQLGNGAQLGTVHSQCFGVNHVHMQFKNVSPATGYSCYYNYTNAMHKAGMTLAETTALGLLGANGTSIRQECSGAQPGDDDDGPATANSVKNYARNGGFNNGSTRWTATNANFQVRADADAYEGTGYGRTNTTQGGRISNDYPLEIESTDHFCMEAMVKADAGMTAGGMLVLWLLGGSGSENSIVHFTATDTWQPVNVCTYATGDHTSLSARIYPATGGNTVSVDAVDVHRSFARNGGFNNGSTRWTADDANFEIRTDGAEYEGTGYARTNSTNNGSIRNDHPMTIKSTHAFCMEAMVRADAGMTANGMLVLWLLGDSGNENSITHFTATDTWQPVKVCTYATGDHTSLSARIYPESGGPTVSVDAVDVHRTLARNGGFNSGTTRWAADDANFAVRFDDDAYEGTGYGRTNTADGGRIRNDYQVAIKSTDAFCMEAMVKADAGTTANGRLILWVLGDSGSESSTMHFTATDTWQPVKVCRYATGDHTSISARIYPESGGPTISVDAVDVH
jgi:hypothetical protein